MHLLALEIDTCCPFLHSPLILLTCAFKQSDVHLGHSPRLHNTMYKQKNVGQSMSIHV